MLMLQIRRASHGASRHTIDKIQNQNVRQADVRVRSDVFMPMRLKLPRVPYAFEITVIVAGFLPILLILAVIFSLLK